MAKDKAEKKAKEAEVSVDLKSIMDEVSNIKEGLEEGLRKNAELVESRIKTFSVTGDAKDKAKAEKAEATLKTVKFLNAVARKDYATVDSVVGDRAKALSEGTAADGGYLVPEEFDRQVLRFYEDYSLFNRLATPLPMGSDVRRLNTATSIPVSGYVSEGSAISTTTITFGEPVLTARKVASAIEWTDELEEDNEVAEGLVNLITERIGQSLAQTVQNEVVNGTTSGSEGILQVSGVTAVTVNTGTAGTGTLFSDISWDDLADMHAALQAVNLMEANRASFLMSPAVYNYLRQSKASGDGNYFTMPAAPTMETPASAWGRPIYVINEMPSTTATGTKFVALSDWSKHVFLGNRRGMRVSISDSHASNFLADINTLKVTMRIANTTALQSGIVTLATN